MRISKRKFSCLLLVLLLGLSACDNSIEPYSQDSTYSIYGFLSLTESRQFIRVKNLNRTVLSDSVSPIEAEVTLENVKEGTSEVLDDSIIVFRDEGQSVATHNFWTDTPVDPQTKYRVTVRGPRGTQTQASTVTPAATKAEITPSSGHCLTTFNVVFHNVESPRLVRAEIGFDHDDRSYLFSRTRQVGFDEQGKVVLTFRVERILSEVIDNVDRDETICQYEPRCWKLDSDKIEIHYTILGPEWYGDVPQDSLTFDPMQSQDVTNGLGFFGSLQRRKTKITVDTTDTIPVDAPFCGG